MMKILMIIGSYRKHGNTDQIVGMIADNLQGVAEQEREPLEIETVYLGHLNIGQCRGCRVCFDRGEEKCPLRDDFLAVKTKMKAADGVLVASPVYVDDVSGLTKTWIDRLAHVCHRPEFGDKSAYLIATVGSSPTSHTLGTLKLALRTWGFHIAGQAGFKMHALMKPEQTQTLFQKKARAVAKEFYQALREKKYAKPSFFALMMFKIQQSAWQRANPQTVDYQYWHAQGWTDPQRNYYIPIQTNPIKVAFARLTGAVIGRFVS